jgi:4'-phosphopantetheinyl transferase
LKNSSSPVRFNVSHSGERGLLAFAMDRDVGVDIEFKRPDVDFAALARSSFSQRECSAVTALLSPEQAELFYEYWTCKEACIKCDGRGLSVPLDGFSVVQGAQPLWRAVEADRSALLPPNLRVKILSDEPSYAAAVAAIGSDWDVERFRVSNSLSAD